MESVLSDLACLGILSTQTETAIDERKCLGVTPAGVTEISLHLKETQSDINSFIDVICPPIPVQDPFIL